MAFQFTSQKNPQESSSSSSSLYANSYWTLQENLALQDALSALDRTSPIFFEDIHRRIPTKTITQIVNRMAEARAFNGMSGLSYGSVQSNVDTQPRVFVWNQGRYQGCPPSMNGSSSSDDSSVVEIDLSEFVPKKKARGGLSLANSSNFAGQRDEMGQSVLANSSKVGAKRKHEMDRSVQVTKPNFVAHQNQEMGHLADQENRFPFFHMPSSAIVKTEPPEPMQFKQPEPRQAKQPNRRQTKQPEPKLPKQPEPRQSKKPERKQSKQAEPSQSKQPERRKSNQPEPKQSKQPQRRQSKQPMRNQSNQPECGQSKQPEPRPSKQPECGLSTPNAGYTRLLTGAANDSYKLLLSSPLKKNERDFESFEWKFGNCSSVQRNVLPHESTHITSQKHIEEKNRMASAAITQRNHKLPHESASDLIARQKAKSIQNTPSTVANTHNQRSYQPNQRSTYVEIPNSSLRKASVKNVTLPPAVSNSSQIDLNKKWERSFKPEYQIIESGSFTHDGSTDCKSNGGKKDAQRLNFASNKQSKIHPIASLSPTSTCSWSALPQLGAHSSKFAAQPNALTLTMLQESDFLKPKKEICPKYSSELAPLPESSLSCFSPVVNQFSWQDQTAPNPNWFEGESSGSQSSGWIMNDGNNNEVICLNDWFQQPSVEVPNMNGGNLTNNQIGRTLVESQTQGVKQELKEEPLFFGDWTISDGNEFKFEAPNMNGGYLTNNQSGGRTSMAENSLVESQTQGFKQEPQYFDDWNIPNGNAFMFDLPNMNGGNLTDNQSGGRTSMAENTLVDSQTQWLKQESPFLDDWDISNGNAIMVKDEYPEFTAEDGDFLRDWIGL